jgi:serine/threonine-protein kinase
MDKVSEGKIGKYEILDRLGKGGMGEVLLARDELLGRRVAIKRPLKNAGEEVIARFEREAKLTAGLRHPNIPAVYDKGVQDGLPFIAMEFVEGNPVSRYIHSKEAAALPMDLITKLRVIEQVCLGLNYAHSLEQPIIHRDIKPENILVQPDGVVKIIDFGIAKEADSVRTSLTATSQVIGSLHYIAPERFTGMKVDGRSDLFSAGVLLFKLLTGTEPFTGGDATASYKIVNEAHTPLSAYLHNYPPELDEIISRSLAKNPEERYQTGEDMADALHEVIEHLKKGRVGELFGDAERLASERRFEPALELLDEALRLDQNNTQVRKLRSLVRDNIRRKQKELRFQETLILAEQALSAQSYDEAIGHLKELANIDPTSTDVHQKLQMAEDKKRRQDIAGRVLAEAEAIKARGDLNGALRILSRAAQDDPDNKKLRAAAEDLDRQIQREANKTRMGDFLASARRQLAARDFPAADASIAQAEAIDPTHPDLDALRRTREQEQRRAALEQIQVHIADFLRNENFDQATDLVNRALEKLPNEPILLRLQVEVETESGKYQLRKFVDSTIRKCRELFATSPMEALAVLQESMKNAPGDEKLIAYERGLRKDMEAVQFEQLLASTTAKARELLKAFDHAKAISVLESFQVEFGQNQDVHNLLELARGEQARTERASILERASTQGRALIEEGRYDEAVQLLGAAVQQTGDGSLSLLLEQAREKQDALSRKVEALQKRVEALRQKGEYDEAIQFLEQQIAAAPARTALQDQLKAIQAERTRKHATVTAIASARQSAGQKDFAGALESLQAVTRAYGETPELRAAAQEIESRRTAHAQQAVEQSVEAARTALVQKNPQAAMDALRATTQLLPFAGEKNQADWQRIAQSVKEALEKSGATVDDQLAALAGARRKLPLWAIVAGTLVVLTAIGVTVWQVLHRPPKIITRISITTQPGASVSLDGNPVGVTDSTGSLVVPSTPQKHKISIAKNRFDPITDTVPLVQGENHFQYPMSPTIVGQPTGTLSVNFTPAPDLSEVRVFIDGAYKQTVSPGQKIPLTATTHKVQYKCFGYDDSNPKDVPIAENGTFTDTVILAKSAPRPKGSLTANPPNIDEGRSATLAWSLQNVDANSKISISGIGQVHGASGTTTVTPSKPTTYVLSVNGSKIVEATVSITNKPPPPPPPAIDYFTTSSDQIEGGKQVTLNWRVSNPGDANITLNNQHVNAQGSSKVTPAEPSATYVLAVGDVQQKITVVVTASPPPPQTQEQQQQQASVDQPLPHVKPHEDDGELIRDVVFKFNSALHSHDLPEMQKLWPSMSAGQARSFQKLFKETPDISISDACASASLTMSGDSANLICTETSLTDKKDQPRPHAIQIVLAKKNGSWSISDRR